MRRLIAAALLLTTTALTAQPNTPQPIFGFKDPAKQHALEAQFDAKLNRDNLRDVDEAADARGRITSARRTGKRTRSSWPRCSSRGATTRRSSGSTCSSRRRRRASSSCSRRSGSRRSSTSRRWPRTRRRVRPTRSCRRYNAYSIDGDVTGELVYVNYGVPKDYEVLERNGIDVQGKIVIARYGGSWRGIKPKVAAEHGAIGCIIYSDPRDDGYFAGRRLSEGRVPQRARRAARLGRGHAGLSRRSADARRRRDEGREAPRSQRRARRSRRSRSCRSPTATRCRCSAPSAARSRPTEWRGALPITYHLGPGPARVHLKLEFDWKLAPAYDVIARMRGTRPRRSVDHARQSSRRLGARRARSDQRHGRADGRSARDRRAGEERLASAPHARLRRLGRRRAGTPRIDGMGRDAPRRAARARGRLHQLRLERPRLPRRRRLAHAGALRHRGRARRRGSAARRVGAASARARGELVNAEDADERKRDPRPRR